MLRSRGLRQAAPWMVWLGNRASAITRFMPVRGTAAMLPMLRGSWRNRGSRGRRPRVSRHGSRCADSLCCNGAVVQSRSSSWNEPDRTAKPRMDIALASRIPSGGLAADDRLAGSGPAIRKSASADKFRLEELLWETWAIGRAWLRRFPPAPARSVRAKRRGRPARAAAAARRPWMGGGDCKT